VPAEYILATSRIRRRRKFKLVFFLDSSFKLLFWLDTTLKLVNSQMLLNAAVVHDRVICEPPYRLHDCSCASYPVAAAQKFASNFNLLFLALSHIELRGPTRPQFCYRAPHIISHIKIRSNDMASRSHLVLCPLEGGFLLLMSVPRKAGSTCHAARAALLNIRISCSDTPLPSLRTVRWPGTFGSLRRAVEARAQQTDVALFTSRATETSLPTSTGCSTRETVYPLQYSGTHL
jgi:hypothetical protein